MKTLDGTYRSIGLAITAGALFAINASLYAAQETDNPTHDGTVVRVTADQLVMTGLEGKEHSHALLADAKFTLDGKACPWANVKPGTRIRVTTQGVDNATAIRVEAIDKNAAFANNLRDGLLQSMTGDKLVMNDAEGNEQSLIVSADATLTLDGKTCKAADLKRGTKIRLFLSDPWSSTAHRIEAIDKNLAFASDRHIGKFVSMTGDQLVMTGADGQKHAITLTADAPLSLDGKPCKAADLKSGLRVRVTTRDAYTSVATRIEALDKNQMFAADQHDGTIVSITGNQLVMSDMEGNNEHRCTLSPEVKISLDGRTVKTADLKPGMKIRVTSHPTDTNLVRGIEALGKNLEFTNTF